MTKLARTILTSITAILAATPSAGAPAPQDGASGARDPLRVRQSFANQEGFDSYRRSASGDFDLVHVHLALLGTPEEHLALPDSGLARSLRGLEGSGGRRKLAFTWERVAELPKVELTGADVSIDGGEFSTRALWLFTNPSGRTFYALAGMPEPELLQDAIEMTRAVSLGARRRTIENVRSLQVFHRECRDFERPDGSVKVPDWLEAARRIYWRPGGLADQARARSRIAARADLTKVRIETPVKAAVTPVYAPELERQSRLHAILLALPDSRPEGLIRAMFRDALDLDPMDEFLGLATEGVGSFDLHSAVPGGRGAQDLPWWPARTFEDRVYAKTLSDGTRSAVRASLGLAGTTDPPADPRLESAKGSAHTGSQLRSVHPGLHTLTFSVDGEDYGAIAFGHPSSNVYASQGFGFAWLGSLDMTGFRTPEWSRTPAKGVPPKRPDEWSVQVELVVETQGSGSDRELLMIELTRPGDVETPVHRVWLARGRGPVRWERYGPDGFLDSIELASLGPKEPR